MELIFENNNRVIGFEKWEDIDCIKILSLYTGTVSGTEVENGTDLLTEGTIEGKETWYFAYKEGYYLKGINEGVMNGKVTASGTQEMVIPLKGNSMTAPPPVTHSRFSEYCFSVRNPSI